MACDPLITNPRAQNGVSRTMRVRAAERGAELAGSVRRAGCVQEVEIVAEGCALGLGGTAAAADADAAGCAVAGAAGALEPTGISGGGVSETGGLAVASPELVALVACDMAATKDSRRTCP